MEKIRALSRGLDILRLLNLHNGATVTEVAQWTQLPRTTANRMLDTLIDEGFVIRDPEDGRYRPTLRVRTLSDGFQDEVWVREIAIPRIHALSRAILWPVAIATPYGTGMLVRGTTDAESPLALERFSAGYSVPMLGSASGLVFLATLSESQRTSMLDALYASTANRSALPIARAELEDGLKRISRQGFARIRIPAQREGSVAVPVMTSRGFLASVVLRHMIAAMEPEEAARRFLGDLQATASDIARQVDTYRADKTG